MNLGPKTIDLIGPIAMNMLSGASTALGNVIISAFGSGLIKAIEKIDTARTRGEIFEKAKEEAKEEAKKKSPNLEAKFEKLNIKDLPKTFLRFEDEEVFCTEYTELCEKITEKGCKCLYRKIMEQFMKYADRSNEFWKEFIAQINIDQLEGIKEIRKEIENKGIEQEKFWKKLLDDYFDKLKQKPPIGPYGEDLPDIADFVNRDEEQTNLEGIIRRKKNMIIIQGMAGIGKTQIAAKLIQNIKNDCISYWKEMRDIDTFDSVTRNLAGFLRENNDSELADYIEYDGTDHEIIINTLLNSLNEKQYALFFDNYQVVENKEVHDLFKRFKEKLTKSTIIITTREPPQFVSAADRSQNKLEEENIEGFEPEATRDYFKQKGVDVSQEQLDRIDQKIGGHPNSLLMFASLSLSGEMEIDEIIEEIEDVPETKIGEYLYDEIYTGLSKVEKEVLKALSVFRTAVTADACIPVSKTDIVREILLSLTRKLIVKRKKKRYYLHDLIREFSYNQIDNPNEYHRRAGEYYAQLEKAPENILETTYHMIKDTGVVNDEIVKYLIGTSKDIFTSFNVLEMLKENEITSTEIFELLNEFVSTSNLTVQKMFIIEYGNFFDKLWQIDHKESVEVLKQILNRADTNLLDMLSRSISKIAYKFPDEACEIWKDIIDKGDIAVRESVPYHIVDSNIDSKIAAPVLKHLLRRNEELGYAPSSFESWPAKSVLDNWGELESRSLTLEDYLKKLKKMSIDEKLFYIKQIKNNLPMSAVIGLLDNVYTQKPDEAVDIIRWQIKDRYRYNAAMQRATKLVAKIAQVDIKYLDVFLNDPEDNVYIKFVGIRALDRIKSELGEETVFALLTPMLADKNPLIRELALILGEEMKMGSTSTVSRENGKKLGILSKLKMLRPKYIIAVLETESSKAAPLTLLMNTWGLQKAAEGTAPELILKLLKPLGKYDNAELRNIYKFIISTLQTDPSMILSIANLGLKLRINHKIGAIGAICSIGHLVPQKALKYLEPLTDSKDPVFSIELACALMDLRDTLPDETKKLFEKLSVHPNGDVRGFAKLMLNGI